MLDFVVHVLAGLLVGLFIALVGFFFGIGFNLAVTVF